jgi:capsid protein
MRRPSLPNLIDRAIAVVAPRVAARRVVARQFLALAGGYGSGGYTGARKDKASLAGWRTPAGSPESDVIADLATLRDRCADLERNSPVGAGVINTNEAHVVGTGLACVPQIDAAFLGYSQEEAEAWQADTRRRFRAWAESPDCDLARRLNLYGIQSLALRSTMSRGDVFVLTPRVERERKPVRLALQLVEADRVANPRGERNNDTLTEGIEHSAETGEPLRVHVLDRHPGDLRGAPGRGLGSTCAARAPAAATCCTCTASSARTCAAACRSSRR